MTQDPIHHNLLTVLSKFKQGGDERKSRRHFLEKTFQLLNFNKINGDFAEFGCPDATVQLDAWHALKRQPFQRRLWAIRDLEPLTLPTDSLDLHPRWPAAQRTWKNPLTNSKLAWSRLPAKASQSIWHGTNRPLHATSLPTQISLTWINAQPHSSIRKILSTLDQHWKNGSILVFEHYYAYSRFERSGARNALLELQKNRPDLLFLPMEKFGMQSQSFLIEDAP